MTIYEEILANPGVPAKELAARLGCHPKYPHAVRSRAKLYGSCQNHYKMHYQPLPHRGQQRWTEDERDFVRANYADMSLKEIGEILGRTRNKVAGWAYRNGISKK